MGPALSGEDSFYNYAVLFDTGGKVGPDLTGSNRGDLDYLLQNIVDPNAVIPNDYRAWSTSYALFEGLLSFFEPESLADSLAESLLLSALLSASAFDDDPADGFFA